MPKATKLKKMNLNSVDLVRRGANQEAHIALFKSDDTPNDGYVLENVNKSYLNDDESINIQKKNDELNFYVGALSESFDLIMKEDNAEPYEKVELLAKSLSEFNETIDDYLSSFVPVDKSYDGLQDDIVTQISSKGEDSMYDLENIDKSLLTIDEAAQLDVLLEKACKKVEKEDGMDDDMDDMDEMPKGKKKAGTVNPAGNQEMEEDNIPPQLKKTIEKALQEVETLKKSAEMKDLTDVAKKYSILGTKEEELAKTLYDMKQAGEDVYKTYVGALDSQLEIVNKSGLFAEIGKSGNYAFGNVAKSDPEAKIDAIAAELMKSDPELDVTTAIAKAWEQNPDLADAYDKLYSNK